MVSREYDAPDELLPVYALHPAVKLPFPLDRLEHSKGVGSVVRATPTSFVIESGLYFSSGVSSHKPFVAAGIKGLEEGGYEAVGNSRRDEWECASHGSGWIELKTEAPTWRIRIFKTPQHYYWREKSRRLQACGKELGRDARNLCQWNLQT